MIELLSEIRLVAPCWTVKKMQVLGTRTLTLLFRTIHLLNTVSVKDAQMLEV